MNAFQWALLILSVAVVIGLVVISQRERRGSRRGVPLAMPEPNRPGGGNQLDIFSASGGSQSAFDEFGVGKPRPRGAAARPPEPAVQRDLLGEPLDTPPPASPPAYLRDPAAGRRAPSLGPVPAPAAEPVATPVPELVAAEPARKPAKPKPVKDKAVTLRLVTRDGQPIAGPALHAALREQGLQFGTGQMYHRLSGEKTVFAVGDLTKPGHLIPEQAEQFQAAGLSLFLVLPGPMSPAIALHDLLSTADQLANRLDGVILDSQKRPLDVEGRQRLVREVEDWARAAGLRGG